jgi:hypothetical protein
MVLYRIYSLLACSMKYFIFFTDTHVQIFTSCSEGYPGVHLETATARQLALSSLCFCGGRPAELTTKHYDSFFRQAFGIAPEE